MPPVIRHLPNAMTGLRLVLACVFFAMLSWYQYEGRGDPTLLNLAFLVYALAMATDFLDGYLARRWHVEGAIGRVGDPLVDKFLVLGAFIFFAGKNFIIPDTEVRDLGRAMVVRTITGVTPAMVVILLARELMVTSLRGASESSGQDFGAVLVGKIKMTLQSVTILVILVYVNYRDWLLRHQYEAQARGVRDLLIYVTIIVTVFSGISYVRRAASLFLSLNRKEPEDHRP